MMSFIIMGFFWGVADAQPIHFKSSAPLVRSPGYSPYLSSSSETYVIQFQSSASEHLINKMKSAGVEFLRYIPQNAYIVRAPSPIIGTLSGVKVFEYSPQLKISPKLGVKKGNLKTDIVIHTFEPASASWFSYLKSIRLIQVSAKRVVARINSDELLTLAQLDQIEFIEPFKKMQFLNYSIKSSAKKRPKGGAKRKSNKISGRETGLWLSHFNKAWARGLSGRGQLLAMADSGLDNGRLKKIHPEFRGRIASATAHGLFSSEWNDPIGHGTHTAGLLVMKGRTSRGQLRGGAYRSKLVFQSLWSEVIDNLYIPSDLAALLQEAYDKGARIHSNSWGSVADFGSYDGYAAQIDEFMWNHPDMLVIFAAGNGGVDKNSDGRVDLGSISAPGTAKNVLTVGASENLLTNDGVQSDVSQSDELRWQAEPLKSDKFSDNPFGLAAFSSRGPTDDGRIKPEIVAPGTNILSVRSRMSGEELWGAHNQNFVFSGGTSVSTPIVAAAAGIVRQYLTQKKMKPSAAMVKAVLVHTAKDLFPGQYGFGAGQEIPRPGPGPEQGFGLLDVGAATDLAGFKLIDEKQGVRSGQSKHYSIKVKKKGKLKITLMYTDYPASPSSKIALVNDLDLRLQIPLGRVVQSKSRRNNWESIELEVKKGIHTVYVDARSLDVSKVRRQPFALVISVK